MNKLLQPTIDLLKTAYYSVCGVQLSEVYVDQFDLDGEQYVDPVTGEDSYRVTGYLKYANGSLVYKQWDALQIVGHLRAHLVRVDDVRLHLYPVDVTGWLIESGGSRGSWKFQTFVPVSFVGELDYINQMMYELNQHDWNNDPFFNGGRTGIDRVSSLPSQEKILLEQEQQVAKPDTRVWHDWLRWPDDGQELPNEEGLIDVRKKNGEIVATNVHWDEDMSRWINQYGDTLKLQEKTEYQWTYNPASKHSNSVTYQQW